MRARMIADKLQKRVWTIQEVAASRSVIVQCRSLKIDFDVLVLVVMLVAKMLARPQPSLSDTTFRREFTQHRMLSLMTDLRHCGPETKTFELPELLAATHQAGATDLRDKLYSLYGITNTSLTDLGLRPDYSLSSRQALIDATYSLLKLQQKVDLLELAEGFQMSNTDYPS